MSLKIIIPFIVASAAVVVFFFTLGGENKPAAPTAASKKSSQEVQSTTNPSLNPTLSSAGGSTQISGETQESSSPGVLPTAKPQILEHIEEAAVSYKAKDLPKIQPFLTHPDPEVRAAAVQGVITLGDAAGGPLLRRAAEVAPSQEEAEAMRRAADYVELPSATMIDRKPKN